MGHKGKNTVESGQNRKNSSFFTFSIGKFLSGICESSVVFAIFGESIRYAGSRSETMSIKGFTFLSFVTFIKTARFPSFIFAAQFTHGRSDSKIYLMNVPFIEEDHKYNFDFISWTLKTS